MGLALRGAPARLKTASAGSPVGGLNTVTPYFDMPPEDAIQLVNFIPGAFGAKVRLGSQVHTHHAASGSAQGIRSIIPFTGLDSANNKLFIATNEGIYDCTVTGASPSLAISFVTTSGLAGYGSWTTFSTPADHFLAYVDEVNGYYLYPESTGTWVRIGSGTQSSATFTPPTSGAATCVINGYIFTSTFNVSAGQTVQDLIAELQAGPDYGTLYTAAAVSGTMVLTAVAAGTGGDGITTTTNGNGGASWSGSATSGGVNGVGGVNPNSFSFVCLWQHRLWFCQHTSSTGWYLPVDQVYGVAKPVFFGANMSHGGELKCMSNWTIDSGNGVGNNLAILNQSGDISVWTGTDPETPGDFTLVGNWFVGGFPTGRNITTDDGGDVLIATSLGVISLAQYLQGLSLADRSLFATKKIQNIISAEVLQNGSNPGWKMIVTPDEQAVLLCIPQGNNLTNIYCMPYASRNWGLLQGRDGNSFGVWQNQLYFGQYGADADLLLVAGGLDGVQLDGSGGMPIPFYIFSAFNGLGAPAVRKRVQMVRTSYLTATSPVSVNVELRYDYDLTPGGPTVPAPVIPFAAVWNVSFWNVDLWGGSGAPTFADERLWGVQGQGRMVAVVMRGAAVESTILTAVSLIYESTQEERGFF